MKLKHFLLTALLLTAMSLVACTAGLQSAEVPATPSPIVQGDPTEGQASLMNDLRESGVEVELGDDIKQAFFAVKGRILKVNSADVQVFEYASKETMEADAALVSTDGSSVGTSMVTWMATPHFFKSGQVLVLYVGDDAAVLEALKNALGEQFAGR
jgi:hypothetical protein